MINMNVHNDKQGEYFAQCEMVNDTGRTVGYIPSWAAKIGNLVELPELDGEFWQVISVGTVLSRSELGVVSRRFRGFQGSLAGGGIDE